jgi:hypothetical protein
VLTEIGLVLEVFGVSLQAIVKAAIKIRKLRRIFHLTFNI